MWDSFIDTCYQISDVLLWLGLLILVLIVAIGLYRAISYFAETQLLPYNEPYHKALWLWLRDTWQRITFLILGVAVIAALIYFALGYIFNW